MADIHHHGEIKYLLYIPSFYGALTWGIWLMLYTMKLVGVNQPGVVSMCIYISVEVLFLLSTYVSFPRYRQAMQSNKNYLLAPASQHITTGLTLLHTVGFLGIVLYVIEFSKNLGGVAGFFLALTSEAHAIRWERETSASIGTQLSYFGWIAIAMTSYQLAHGKISRWWSIPAFIQFIGNLLFIDRTRPIWILFTSSLMIVPVVKHISITKLAKSMVGAAVLVFTLFWLVAEWTGKTTYEGKFEDSVLPGISQEFYVYGISGFAYFDKMLNSSEQISYSPERLLYPAIKYLARFELAQEPPSQILEFYDVPFSTNVGTFLEPFYRDGGLLFVLCGIIICSFGFDAIGLFLLQSGKSLAIYAWTNICFAALIGFFTPKIASLPIWLFVGLGLGSLLFNTGCNENCYEKSTLKKIPQ